MKEQQGHRTSAEQHTVSRGWSVLCYCDSCRQKARQICFSVRSMAESPIAVSLSFIFLTLISLLEDVSSWMLGLSSYSTHSSLLDSLLVCLLIFLVKMSWYCTVTVQIVPLRFAWDLNYYIDHACLLHTQYANKMAFLCWWRKSSGFIGSVTQWAPGPLFLLSVHCVGMLPQFYFSLEKNVVNCT